MRFAVAFAGVAFALALCAAQTAQPVVAALPATQPAWLPQDYAARLAAADRRRSDELEFLKDAYVGQYSAFGNCSPRWDAQAKEALEAWVTGSLPELSGGDTDSVLWYAGLGAIGAGCTDPLLTRAVARNKSFWQGDGKEVRNLEIRAARAMKDSGYHGIHRIMCLLRGAQYLGDPQYDPTPAEKTEAMALIDVARAQAGDAVREEGLPRHEMVNVLVVAGRTSLAITGDRWKLAEGIYRAIEQQGVDRSALLSMKGQLYVEYASDGGDMDEVAGGKTPSEQRQEIAEKLLREAWELDHGNTWATLWQMRLARARQAGDEEFTFMLWFRRTLEADPDMLQAYQEMKDYLVNHQSREAALQFGRECARWLADRSEARLMIADMHLAATGPTWVPDSAADQPYFHSDPQIWKDVSAAYDPFIKSRNVSQHHSIRYALMAIWCGQWERARELLEPIKEYRGHREISAKPFAEMRKRVDAHFQKP